MKVVLVSRYPRVDTLPWKQTVAARLLDAGCDVDVLYSRSTLTDQLRAGLKEDGLGLIARYARLRGRGSGGGGATSLADWSRERGIGVHSFRRLGDDDALRRLREINPDLLVLLGADLVPRSVLEIPTIGTLNPHYGLLPQYRGMNTTEWSLFLGDEPGVTVHMVDPGIDTGDIVLQRPLEVVPGDTLASLRTKHQAAAADLLPEAALALMNGTAERTAQPIEAGRQFYRMHPLLKRRVEESLEGRPVAPS